MNKVILLNRSPYNFFGSTISIDKLVSYAEENKLSSIGLLERNTLIGSHEFYSKCKKKNIKPIISLEVLFDSYSIILVPINTVAFEKLISISNQHSEDSNFDFSLIKKEDNIHKYMLVRNEKESDIFVKNNLLFEGAFVSENKIFKKLGEMGLNVYHQRINTMILEEDKDTLELLDKLNNSDHMKTPTPISIETSPSSDNLNKLVDEVNLDFTTKVRELPEIIKHQD